MRCVYKYPFPIADKVTVTMPRGAEVVHVECQDDVPCLWALVDPSHEMEVRELFVFGTGHPISDGLRHVATFQMPPFVWHLFEAAR